MSDETNTIEAPAEGVQASPEQTTAPEGAEQTTPKEEEQPWRKPKVMPLDQGIRYRQERNQYRDRAAYLEGQLALLQGGAPKTPEPSADPDEIDPAKFDNPRDFIKAVEARAEKRAIEAVRAELQGAKQGEESQRLAQAFDQRVRQAATSAPDLVERVAYLESPQVVNSVQPVIWRELLESEHSPAIIVEITSNPEALRALQNPDPVEAAKAFAMIESRVSSQTAPTPKQEAETPPAPAFKPTPKVAGSAPTPSKDLNDPNLSADEFSRLWDEKHRRNRR